MAEIHPSDHPGYKGIWYYNQKQGAPYSYKYSGGFAFYPQQMAPLAIYSPAANKTFFVFGGTTDGQQIHNMVSYYDHATGTVPQPKCVLTRQTFDAHYNATLGIDPDGYIYVFCNSHGVGFELSETDPTHGKAYVFRSDSPYSIESFTQITDENFSYSQVWMHPKGGLFWFHTRYAGQQRGIYWTRSSDGKSWEPPRQFADIGKGNYQVSWAAGDRIATAFDFHPEPDGLNARTNIYYTETSDAGDTWTTASGVKIEPPLKDPANPALVHDYQKEGKLVYLKDLAFDRVGHPIILYITTHGPWSGPASGPRAWCLTRWTGTEWKRWEIGPATHNYDHGSLYIEEDGTWRLIAPLDLGPQEHGTGGQVVMQTSQDEGLTWRKIVTFPIFDQLNQTYVRKPWLAHPDLYALWADGDAYKRSVSRLYFCDLQGRMYRLPETMTESTARPELVYQP